MMSLMGTPKTTKFTVESARISSKGAKAMTLSKGAKAMTLSKEEMETMNLADKKEVTFIYFPLEMI